MPVAELLKPGKRIRILHMLFGNRIIKGRAAPMAVFIDSAICFRIIECLLRLRIKGNRHPHSRIRLKMRQRVQIRKSGCAASLAVCTAIVIRLPALILKERMLQSACNRIYLRLRGLCSIRRLLRSLRFIRTICFIRVLCFVQTVRFTGSLLFLMFSFGCFFPGLFHFLHFLYIISCRLNPFCPDIHPRLRVESVRGFFILLKGTAGQLGESGNQPQNTGCRHSVYKCSLSAFAAIHGAEKSARQNQKPAGQFRWNLRYNQRKHRRGQEKQH